MKDHIKYEREYRNVFSPQWKMSSKVTRDQSITATEGKARPHDSFYRAMWKERASLKLMWSRPLSNRIRKKGGNKPSKQRHRLERQITAETTTRKNFVMLSDGLSRSYEHHFKEGPTQTLQQMWEESLVSEEAVELQKLMKEYAREVNQAERGTEGACCM